jgi:putative tricarboxylic transport membrane protein
MKIAVHRDFVLGFLVLAFATFGLWYSRDLPVGTAAEMQAGYFPRLIFWLLLGLGLLSLLQGLRKAGSIISAQPHPEWLRAALGVTSAVVVFALTVQPLGLAAASALLCLIGAAASSSSRMREAVVLAAGLAVASAIIFSWALGLPIPIGPRW